MEDGSLIFAECFVSIHFFLFVITPLCALLNKNERKYRVILMGIVAVLLIISNIKIGAMTTMSIYFLSIFILGFPLSIISSIKGKISSTSASENKITNSVLNESDSYLNELIKTELNKLSFEKNDSIPIVEKRRTIAYLLLYVLVFLTMCFYFFHIGFIKIGIFIIIGIIIFLIIKNVSINKYIIKQIKARPDEKILNIIENTLQQKTHKKVLLPFILLPIIIPCIIFFEPHVLYESFEDGYRIRFYTIGIINPEKIEIPEEYNGKPITAIRGNVFANITSVKEIELPNTITTINGGAFENTRNLEYITLPNKLEYLGGGAFRNSGIKEIILPDTLKEMGGEVFQDCHRLKKVKLSESLKEIRGNSFENATALEEIYIPDGITEIRAHAFHGCYNLKKVRFPNTLQEIGSSAFRDCYSLSCINIVDTCIINPKAFKNSNTYKEKYSKELQYKADEYYNNGTCIEITEVGYE